LLLLAALPLALATPARAAAVERLPFPAELQKDVDFWVRVYSEISTSEGFLHDERDLAIVYRKLRFEKDVTPKQRRDAVDDARKDIEQMLRRLAAGATDLSDEERQVASAFGKGAGKARFTEAATRVRFQLGQSDRFREGLERSGIWESHIAETFANLGLPPELAALPHVESSFDPTAYSKVGAAGLWQFMRATGRRFLRIDETLDERMDPFRATEAAAQLLDFNYRLLGSWPLALTAYNHGAEGMRRARDSMGTTDIAVIARNYKSKSFGFASRNFYVSFLAALTIDREPEKYFPGIQRRPEMRFTEVELPAYIPVTALQKTLGIEARELKALNPALLAPVWSGDLFVPKGYRLRLPANASQWSGAKLAQSVSLDSQFLSQPRARSHVVRSGESLSLIARRHGVSLTALARLNGMETTDTLLAGATLRLPVAPAAQVSGVRLAAVVAPVAEASPSGPPPAASVPVVVTAQQVSDTLADQQNESRAAEQSARTPEPVSESEVEEHSPSLVPGGAVARASEAIDFSIRDDGAILVAAEETLGHYAQWLGIPTSRLRSLNGLSARAAVPLGRTLKLDFSKVSHEQFDAKRRAFHDAMQATFFAAHRIVGTQVYVTRRGDSLWNVSQRGGGLPAWLVLHYNPDIDFSALRAGQEIVIPKIEVLATG